MGTIFHYRCDRCSELAKLQIGIGTHGCYMTPDAIPPRLHCQAAWCYGCESLSQAEKLLSRDQLIEFHGSGSKIIQEMEFRNGWSKKQIGFHQQRIDGQLESGLRLQRIRRTPPRCLRCGSTNIKHYSSEEISEGKYRHPNCGGYFIKYEHDRIKHIMLADYKLTIDGLSMHNLSTTERFKYYLQYIWYFIQLHFSS